MKTYYEKWNSGEIPDEAIGGFDGRLFELFSIASDTNKAKLTKAFPEHFVHTENNDTILIEVLPEDFEEEYLSTDQYTNSKDCPLARAIKRLGISTFPHRYEGVNSVSVQMNSITYRYNEEYGAWNWERSKEVFISKLPAKVELIKRY